MAADTDIVGSGPHASLRRGWLVATVLLTVGPVALVVFLAPPIQSSPSTALVWLLFVGSSVHVGATAWFYTVAEVRAHMRHHPWRYFWIPLALVLSMAAVASAVSTATMTWVLSGYFAWQFFHFQKQNLGMSALAARAVDVPGLTRVERHALTLAGVGGIGWLVGHPSLLQLSRHDQLESRLHAVMGAVSSGGACLFVAATIVGSIAMLRRPPSDRPGMFLTVYGSGLIFFAPVFVFDSPYAAVAGLTIAHGLQYLLLMGLIAGAPAGVAPAQVRVLVLLNIAVIVGLALNQASHLHAGRSPTDGLLFGAYLGVVTAHFVIDAGLWRLRDSFPRSFLTRRLPYLLAPR